MCCWEKHDSFYHGQKNSPDLFHIHFREERIHLVDEASSKCINFYINYVKHSKEINVYLVLKNKKILRTVYKICLFIIHFKLDIKYLKV